jgi:hypothetical protein
MEDIDINIIDGKPTLGDKTEVEVTTESVERKTYTVKSVCCKDFLEIARNNLKRKRGKFILGDSVLKYCPFCGKPLGEKKP